jgi:hypothetical protein
MSSDGVQPPVFTWFIKYEKVVTGNEVFDAVIHHKAFITIFCAYLQICMRDVRFAEHFPDPVRFFYDNILCITFGARTDMFMDITEEQMALSLHDDFIEILDIIRKKGPDVFKLYNWFNVYCPWNGPTLTFVNEASFDHDFIYVMVKSGETLDLHTNLWSEENYAKQSFTTWDSCVDFWMGASHMYDLLLVKNDDCEMELLIRYNIDYSWMNDFVLSGDIVSKQVGKDIIRRMNDTDMHAMYEKSLSPTGSDFSGLALPFSTKVKDYKLKNHLAVSLAASKYRADHIRVLESINHDTSNGTNIIPVDTIMSMSPPGAGVPGPVSPLAVAGDFGIPGSPFGGAGIPGSPFGGAGIPGSPFGGAGIPGSPFGGGVHGSPVGAAGCHQKTIFLPFNAGSSPIHPNLFEEAYMNSLPDATETDDFEDVLDFLDEGDP